jgi:septum formation protein
MSLPSFVLASASPARRKLLQTIGIEPIVRQSNFDESQIQLRNPVELVETLAQKKAETIATSLEKSLILGCDSILEVRGDLYGKPASETEAITRWKQMRGHHGMLYTGHCLIDQLQNQTLIRCSITIVHFAQISDRTIEDYVRSGEPLKCAGCFALEGKGGLFVEKLEGCHSNVIGLSLPLLRQMLTDLNYDICDFWIIN